MSTAAEDPTLLSTLTSTGVHKRTQGRLVRQITLSVLLAGILLGCFRLSQTYLLGYGSGIRLGIPAGLFAIGAWASYRLIHWPRFADFLVAVQGELDKVNWASWDYLFRATGVVIVTMTIVTAFLWTCNLVLIYLFEFIGFLRVVKPN